MINYSVFFRNLFHDFKNKSYLILIYQNHLNIYTLRFECDGEVLEFQANSFILIVIFFMNDIHVLKIN